MNDLRRLGGREKPYEQSGYTELPPRRENINPADPEQYAVCLRRGHGGHRDNPHATGLITGPGIDGWNKCEWCGVNYRVETKVQLVERNEPRWEGVPGTSMIVDQANQQPEAAA